MGPIPTRTAVLVPVEPAEQVVRRHRRDLDVAASWGVPAHVTVLFPFVPPARVDADVISRRTAALAQVEPFDATFRHCAWFGEEVLWLAPERDHEFRDLTLAVAEAFPDHPPYGGVFDEVTPHLTIGQVGRGATSPDQLRAAEADVAAHLPIRAHLDHALLMAGAEEPGSWHTLARLPLGAGLS